MNFPRSLHLFCRVVDNYGDIGICWRLARQLQHEHAIAVTLWVDDLRSFQRLCPAVVNDVDTQHVAGVEVRHWRDQQGTFAVDEVADIVIEFFGVDLPPGYIEAMAKRMPRPVWINLEGLSAEEWVEGCHTLPSPHPRLPLTKHFFFPGFTARTGGLLHEAALEDECARFQSDPAAVATFFSGLGVPAAEAASFKVSLFCYPHAPVSALFDTWRGGDARIACLVPEGVAAEAVSAFLGAGAIAGAAMTRGALTVRVLPFVTQPDYDRLLWACDLNFVRGEDSWVRAQWAGVPFVWHIYPQDNALHHVKLRAFLQRYADQARSPGSLSLLWNGVTHGSAEAWPAQWHAFGADMAEMTRRAVTWRQKMRENGDLAGNLLRFARAVRSAAEKSDV